MKFRNIIMCSLFFSSVLLLLLMKYMFSLIRDGAYSLNDILVISPKNVLAFKTQRTIYLGYLTSMTFGTIAPSFLGPGHRPWLLVTKHSMTQTEMVSFWKCHWHWVGLHSETILWTRGKYLKCTQSPLNMSHWRKCTQEQLAIISPHFTLRIYACKLKTFVCFRWTFDFNHYGEEGRVWS